MHGYMKSRLYTLCTVSVHRVVPRCGDCAIAIPQRCLVSHLKLMATRDLTPVRFLKSRVSTISRLRLRLPCCSRNPWTLSWLHAWSHAATRRKSRQSRIKSSATRYCSACTDLQGRSPHLAMTCRCVGAHGLRGEVDASAAHGMPRLGEGSQPRARFRWQESSDSAR